MVRGKGLLLRPHVKTPKTAEGARIQANAERETNVLVTGFVASTLPEVKILVESKYDLPRDILYGVPISQAKLEPLDAMRQEFSSNEGQIHVMIDHPTQVTFVEDYVKSQEKSPFSAFIKLDTGYHRAGITCDERGVDLALKIIRSPFLSLQGVYSHCGHAYDESSDKHQQDIAKVDIEQIASFLDLLKQQLESLGENSSAVNDLIVSVGSTPSARHHESLKGLANPIEIHPGNYTLFDRQQLWTGACTEADVAARVMSRVVGHYGDRNTILLDAGATALTKDDSPQGSVCEIGGHPELDCYKMSQEVTLVRPKDPHTIFPYAKFPLGSIVDLLPNHSCLSAACFEKYYVIDDPSCSFSPNQEIVDEWIPAKYFDIK